MKEAQQKCLSKNQVSKMLKRLTYKTSFYFAGNYSVAGFELTLQRKVSHYIITYYLPSGMFVIVSWISFLVPPEIVPGRMTLLVTVFLVLVNIFNTITRSVRPGCPSDGSGMFRQLTVSWGRGGSSSGSISDQGSRGPEFDSRWELGFFLLFPISIS